MKYTKQLMKMANELNGKYTDAGFTINGFYVETSSITNIYRNNELIKTFKTPQGAMNYLKKNI
jgi:hypothetical protein